MVPFELGRPLGVPGDLELQTRLVMRALALATNVAVPIIEWFDEASPQPGAAADSGWACPVNFARRTEAIGLGVEVIQEVALLRPWHDRASAARGGTRTGAAGMPVEAAADFLASFLDESVAASPNPELTPADSFKLAAEDLKLYYLEAATAQPGATSRDLADWFWKETAAAELLRALAERLSADDNLALRIFATATLVPEKYR
ncbi:MAG: hypothetical protein ACNA7W_05525 [Pseudomonadales bacterium]